MEFGSSIAAAILRKAVPPVAAFIIYAIAYAAFIHGRDSMVTPRYIRNAVFNLSAATANRHLMMY